MQLIVTFPSVEQPRRLHYSCARGVDPGVWVMEAIPQVGSIDPLGNLFFTDGASSVTLASCRVRSVSLRYGVNGPVLRIIGVDRRWAWHGKAIDGVYNVRLPDGTIDTTTQKSARELGTLLWAAMGEPGADVSRLPDNSYPFVDWECAEAASELEELCARYGCEPSLQVANDEAGVFLKGTGPELPNNLDIKWTQEVTSGVLPNRVEACSNHARWQSKFRVRPILRDTEGVWKLADEVSYAPVGGWDGNVSDPNDPLPPDAAGWTALKAELAKDLWKMWAIMTFADGTLNVPGYQVVPDRTYILPVDDDLLDPYIDENGDAGQDAYLMGTARVDSDPDDPAENTPTGSHLDISFTLDRVRGFVRTSVPVPKLDSEGALEAAELYLVCSHRVRYEPNNQFVRHVQFQAPGGLGGVDTLRLMDIERRIISNYGSGANHTSIVSTDDNQTSVEQEMNDAINLRIAELSPRAGMIRQWNGVQPIPLSGTVDSVEWFLDCERPRDNNCTTTAWRNVEGGTIAYARERFRRNQVAAFAATRSSRQVAGRRLTRRGVV